MSNLNTLLLNQIRLAIISYLIVRKTADFGELKTETNSTAGNLSVQINKLQEAGYIVVEKSFKNNYPLTTCTITEAGIKAFDEFVKQLKKYI